MRKRSALIALCAWWLALMAVIAGTEGKALFKTKPSDVHLDDGYAMRIRRQVTGPEESSGKALFSLRHLGSDLGYTMRIRRQVTGPAPEETSEAPDLTGAPPPESETSETPDPTGAPPPDSETSETPDPTGAPPPETDTTNDSTDDITSDIPEGPTTLDPYDPSHIILSEQERAAFEKNHAVYLFYDFLHKTDNCSIQTAGGLSNDYPSPDSLAKAEICVKGRIKDYKAKSKELEAKMLATTPAPNELTTVVTVPAEETSPTPVK